MMEQLIKDIERQYGKEKAAKVRDVVVVVTAKVQAKNLFGWRSFLEDALVETISWIIRTEFQYSGGAYVACGMQSAIDHCRYCNAKKRRQDYEMLSLDDEESKIQVAESDDGRFYEIETLCTDIASKFGKELAEELRPFLQGDEKSLDKKVLAKIQAPEFKSWFEQYRGR